MFEAIVQGIPFASLDGDDVSTMMGIGCFIREQMRQGIVLFSNGKKLNPDDIEVEIKVKQNREALDYDNGLCYKVA